MNQNKNNLVKDAIEPLKSLEVSHTSLIPLMFIFLIQKEWLKILSNLLTINHSLTPKVLLSNFMVEKFDM